MATDLPTMNASAYTSNTNSLAGFVGGAGIGMNTGGYAGSQTWGGGSTSDATSVVNQIMRRIPAIDAVKIAQTMKEEDEVAEKRRIVKVYIVDTDKNIPLDQCVLYSGEEKLTDANDQELFFEIDIQTILKAHNEKRTKIVKKEVKDRTEYLEPARIRDLTMTVVTVASF